MFLRPSKEERKPEYKFYYHSHHHRRYGNSQKESQNIVNIYRNKH